MLERINIIAEKLEEVFIYFWSLENGTKSDDEEWEEITRLCSEINTLSIIIVYRSLVISKKQDIAIEYFEELLIKPYEGDFEKVDKLFWERIEVGNKEVFSKRDSAVAALGHIKDDIEREIGKVKEEVNLEKERLNHLKRWINDYHIAKFIKIEDELIKSGYLSNPPYCWNVSKKKLLDLLCILKHNGFFMKKVSGISLVKVHHYRQFISERYGFGKTGLTGVAQKYQPPFKDAEDSFKWIKDFIK